MWQSRAASHAGGRRGMRSVRVRVSALPLAHAVVRQAVRPQRARRHFEPHARVRLQPRACIRARARGCVSVFECLRAWLCPCLSVRGVGCVHMGVCARAVVRACACVGGWGESGPGAGGCCSDRRGLCKRTSARGGNIERSAAAEPRDTWAVGLRRQCARHLSTHARAHALRAAVCVPKRPSRYRWGTRTYTGYYRSRRDVQSWAAGECGLGSEWQRRP